MQMPAWLKIGARVKTRLGMGTVEYWRNAPPTFDVASAVSVRLDSKVGFPGYVGTMFSMAEVESVEQEDGGAGCAVAV